LDGKNMQLSVNIITYIFLRFLAQKLNIQKPNLRKKLLKRSFKKQYPIKLRLLDCACIYLAGIHGNETSYAPLANNGKREA
jgi:hypothetical protein